MLASAREEYEKRRRQGKHETKPEAGDFAKLTEASSIRKEKTLEAPQVRTAMDEYQERAARGKLSTVPKDQRTSVDMAKSRRANLNYFEDDSKPLDFLSNKVEFEKRMARMSPYDQLIHSSAGN